MRRRWHGWGWAGLAGFGTMMLPGVARAHGIGGRQDLPVPLEFFMVGAAVVLVLSFAALAVLWPEPRLQDPPRERLLTGTWLGVLRGVGMGLGVVLLAVTLVAGLVGLDNGTRNPVPVIVFVVFWLVIPFTAALVGNAYPSVAPWQTLARWLDLGRSENPDSVTRWGYLPATFVFVAFTWLELVYPDNGSPRHLAIATLVYTVAMLGAAEWIGRTSSMVAVDGLGAYNHVLGAIAPLGRARDGSGLAWRGWLRALPHVEERRWLPWMIIAMIGSVTYDGASSTPWWRDVIVPLFDPLTFDLMGLGRYGAGIVTGTVGLVTVTIIMGVAYRAASAFAARLGGSGITGGRVVYRFAHTLVPIAFAYAIAHYFTLILFEGQLFLITMSDPLGRGWDLLGTAGWAVNYTWLSPTLVWYFQVAFIVGGHVAGVVLAHDRALADFPAETAVRSQYAMLGLMVLLTGVGLTILAAG